MPAVSKSWTVPVEQISFLLKATKEELRAQWLMKRRPRMVKAFVTVYG